MKIYQEKSLSRFDFWGNAKSNVEQLSDCELNQIEIVLEDAYPDGINETSLNDIFAYDFEWVCEVLDIKPWYEDESK